MRLKEDLDLFGMPLAESEAEEIITLSVKDILASKKSFEAASRSNSSGRGSKSEGPLEVWITEDGRYLLVDGYHRFADGIANGKKSFEVKIVGRGYTDYWATPMNGDEFLDEGANGDWKSEGYTFKLEYKKMYNGENGVFIQCFDKDGNRVGSLDAATSQSYPGYLFPSGVKVDQKHQRKGIASAMYKYAEKKTGKRMVPADQVSDDPDNMTGDAKKLWSQPKRKFGESKSGINIYSDADLPSGVKIGLEHCPEGNWNAEERGEEWHEDEFNYRLNAADDIFYAVKDNEVVGHLGLREGKVEGVYVDASERGNGIAIDLYLEAVKLNGKISSDPVAQEPGGKGIWKSLKKMYPDRVELKRNEFVMYDEPQDMEEMDATFDPLGETLNQEPDEADLDSAFSGVDREPYDDAIDKGKYIEIPLKDAKKIMVIHHNTYDKDVEKFMKVMLADPIILFNVGNKLYAHDGQHRLNFAIKYNLPSISAYVIRLDPIHLDGMENDGSFDPRKGWTRADSQEIKVDKSW